MSWYAGSTRASSAHTVLHSSRYVCLCETPRRLTIGYYTGGLGGQLLLVAAAAALHNAALWNGAHLVQIGTRMT
jgi:hypothetical protein